MPGPDEPRVLLALAPGVQVTEQGVTSHGILVHVTDPMLVAALGAGMSLDPAAAPPMLDLLDRLHRAGMLCLRVPGLAEARPLTRGVRLPALPPAPAIGGQIPLSRFAVIRRSGQDWLLETGRNAWQVRLTDAGLSGLADPEQLGNHAEPLLRLLSMTGMLAAGDDDPGLSAWEPHDLYFASRSRRDVASVASEARRRATPAPPAHRPDYGTPRSIRLPSPTGPEPYEPSLWEASEARRTIREFAATPVPLSALATLLWRTLRVVRTVPADESDRASYDGVLRPVPSGGAMHSIDLWLLCRHVQSVPQGVWRYDPARHRLVEAPAPPGQVLMTSERLMGPDGGGPAVLGLLTTRHARTAWKYAGIAYALELKDVGVIMHALQLTAGAVGLGLCPWGSGPTRATAELLSVDPLVDAPVGEFVLGVPLPT